MEPGIMLYDTENYQLISFGNGLAYEFRDKYGDPDENLFFRGDSATHFREELEALEEMFPDKHTNDILTELFQLYN